MTSCVPLSKLANGSGSQLPPLQNGDSHKSYSEIIKKIGGDSAYEELKIVCDTLYVVRKG